MMNIILYKREETIIWQPLHHSLQIKYDKTTPQPLYPANRPNDKKEPEKQFSLMWYRYLHKVSCHKQTPEEKKDEELRKTAISLI